MTNLQRFAMALAGFAAGFVLAGVLMVVVIEAFKAFVYQDVTLEGHSWWLPPIAGGIGGAQLFINLARRSRHK